MIKNYGKNHFFRFFLLVIKNISLLREVLISMCSNMLEFLDIFLYSMDYKIVTIWRVIFKILYLYL